MINEIDIRVSPLCNSNPEYLREEIAQSMGLALDDISDFKVLKRSIDARPKFPVYQLKILVAVNENLPPELEIKLPKKEIQSAQPVIIVGAGPAGLFAALELIELGLKPILLERGKNVRDRRRDLAAINQKHLVHPDSNYCFGEGGAGTYSDGKLYTRSNKRGDVNKVLQILVAFGADPNILVDAHPHIGTNKLPKIIGSIREYILACGGEIHFETKLTDVTIQNGKVKSVICDNIELECQHLILATGHSARDIFQLLHDKKILIENKPFALGVRVEHAQNVIDASQYHSSERDINLPPASYSLVTQTPEKAVYSFCMCPGGIVAPCATQNGEIVTNGWSPSKRNNPFANSGIVVPVDENDWKVFSEYGPLAALKFQSSVEVAAFNSVNKGQTAPAQRLEDFIKNKNSITLPKSSYQPGIEPVELAQVLPPKFHKALQLGFIDFGKKIKDFRSNEAVLHGVESRTSSPVKIPRNPETLQHPQISNLYPCGEGAGYAGGIMSAAIDGQKCAQKIKNGHS